MLSKQLLDILCCPKCKGDLLYQPDDNKLTCRKCDKIYPVRNGIPIMLIDEEMRNNLPNEPSKQQ